MQAAEDDAERRAREELERSLADVSASAAPMVEVVYEPEGTSGFELDDLQVGLDGKPLQAPPKEVLNQPGEHRIHYASSGAKRHELVVQAAFKSTSSSLFSYMADFRWRVTSKAEFVPQSGLLIQVRIVPLVDEQEGDPKKKLRLALRLRAKPLPSPTPPRDAGVPKKEGTYAELLYSTDAGYRLVTALPDGGFRVAVRMPDGGFQLVSERAVAPLDGGVRTVVAAAPLDGGTRPQVPTGPSVLKVSVVSKQKKLSGTEVRLRGPTGIGPEQSASFLQGQSFGFEVVPGPQVVEVLANGMLAQLVAVKVAAGQTHELKVELVPAGRKRRGAPSLSSTRVLFSPGAAKLEASVKGIVARAVDVMVRAGIKRVRLEGHCDTKEPCSEALPRERAEAVAAALQAAGIDASRLEVKAFGASRPAAPNLTQRGRQLNRRVELVAVEP